MAFRLGIVSDTHGHLANTREAVRQLIPWQVDEVIHCGDIGSVEIPSLFSDWPTHFVFGNVDRDREPLRQAIEQAGQTCHGVFGQIAAAGCQVGFLHGDDARLFREALDSRQWDLLCYGHTHQAEWKRVDHTWLLNPGAVYRARPHSVAVLELPDFAHHSLEF